MATIKEDYVSFETAKLLKDKGFSNNWCNRWYNTNIRDPFPSSVGAIGCLPCPSQAMAMKWLREVHKISIEITSTGYLIDNDVEWECDIKAGHRLYFKHITNEKSFESCVEAAIKYCLVNLI